METAAGNGSPNPQQPGGYVQPVPVSVTVSVIPASVAPDGRPHVVTRVESCNGSFQFFLDPGAAEGLGKVLTSAALRVRSGLITPDG